MYLFGRPFFMNTKSNHLKKNSKLFCNLDQVLPSPSNPIAGAAVPLQQGACAQTSSSNNPEVLSAFECPVCMEYMLPPYLQCQSGHLVCGSCRPKLACCPTCRGAVRKFSKRNYTIIDSGNKFFHLFVASVRNLVLEKIANTVSFPCKYSCYGCPTTMQHTEKMDHEEACEFKSV